MRQALATIILLGMILGLAGLGCSRPGINSEPHIVAAQRSLGHTWAARVTCSGAACHGQMARSAGMTLECNEYTTWACRDPHAAAWETLISPESVRMTAALGWESNPLDEARCVSCHGSGELTSGGRFKVDMSCAGCHGESGSWLEPHPAWTGLADSKRRELYRNHGMVWMQDPFEVAQQCCVCHVGGPNRDVDHAMIAAGHPRLTFEFGSYRRHLPPHWRPQETASDANARLGEWVAGQRALGMTALKQLARHAEPESPGGPDWPELSDFSCSGCHREIWSPDTPPGSRTGRLRMNEWPVTGISDLAQVQGDKAWPDRVARLDKLLGKLSMRRDDRDEVAGQAREMARYLKTWQSTLSDDEESALLRLHVDGINPGQSWEARTQRYLGLWSLRPRWEALSEDEAQRQRNRKVLDDSLDTIGRQLTLPRWKAEQLPNASTDPAADLRGLLPFR